MKPENIFVAGHNGMVGSAIIRRLRQQSTQHRIVVAERNDIDLTDQQAVGHFFASEHIDQVYLAAAKVGGIHANNAYPAEFIYENLMIEANIIHQARVSGVRKLLFPGSNCIYPKHAPQPIVEAELLNGALEPTNEPYAIAKIAGIKLCESCNRQYGVDYRSVMPANLYGLNDNFHPENSHVIPAMMRRFHEASIAGSSEVVVWGSGKARREFLHVDDMAAACVHVMNLDKSICAANTEPMRSHINIGTGVDYSIRELAETMAVVTGFTGRIRFDTSRPDGTPRKLLDVNRIRKMGWEAVIRLEQGLADTYEWFLKNSRTLRT